jgi:hypothetical protein
MATSRTAVEPQSLDGGEGARRRAANTKPAPPAVAPAAPAASSRPRNKNWLIITNRRWHTWLGVVMSGFVIVVCLTGIYLNHADLFAGKPQGEHKLSGALSTSTALASVPVGFEGALLRARERWGDAPIEKIELKDEQGRLVYKLKAGEGRDLEVDATSGAVAVKDNYAKSYYGAGGERLSAGYDWKKVFNDLHTGKIFGGPGKLLVDFTSVVLVVLTISGIHLWAVPKLRKREQRRHARSAGAARPTPSRQTN